MRSCCAAVSAFIMIASPANAARAASTNCAIIVRALAPRAPIRRRSTHPRQTGAPRGSPAPHCARSGRRPGSARSGAPAARRRSSRPRRRCRCAHLRTAAGAAGALPAAGAGTQHRQAHQRLGQAQRSKSCGSVCSTSGRNPRTISSISCLLRMQRHGDQRARARAPAPPAARPAPGCSRRTDGENTKPIASTRACERRRHRLRRWSCRRSSSTLQPHARALAARAPGRQHRGGQRAADRRLASARCRPARRRSRRRQPRRIRAARDAALGHARARRRGSSGASASSRPGTTLSVDQVAAVDAHQQRHAGADVRAPARRRVPGPPHRRPPAARTARARCRLDQRVELGAGQHAQDDQHAAGARARAPRTPGRDRPGNPCA